MPALKSILVVDDEASIRESLDMFLREKGYRVRLAASGAEGLTLWNRHRPRVVVLDVRLPDISGLEVLKKIIAKDPEANVIIITAFHDMDSTIAAMRQGAYDFLNKPLDVDELEQAVSRAMRMNEALCGSRVLSRPAGETAAAPRLVGRTPAMRSIFKTVGLLARNRATVLIEGETGTGKELIAKVIHQSSLPSGQPFVTVDCTTLVENLLESELFGHERGAFTGATESKPGRLELAGEGAIFFDEIGELPSALQAKLLRFLEYREFSRVGGTQVLRSAARIIAASNRDLVDLVGRGRFRPDLLYRLKVVSILVPPLRERKEGHDYSLPTSAGCPAPARAQGGHPGDGGILHLAPEPGAFDQGGQSGKGGDGRPHGPRLARQRARAEERADQGRARLPGRGAARRDGADRVGQSRPPAVRAIAPAPGGPGGQGARPGRPDRHRLELLGHRPRSGHFPPHPAQAHAGLRHAGQGKQIAIW